MRLTSSFTRVMPDLVMGGQACRCPSRGIYSPAFLPSSSSRSHQVTQCKAK